MPIPHSLSDVRVAIRVSDRNIDYTNNGCEYMTRTRTGRCDPYCWGRLAVRHADWRTASIGRTLMALYAARSAWRECIPSGTKPCRLFPGSAHRCRQTAGEM